MVALNSGDIESHAERVSIKTFINKYNWKKIIPQKQMIGRLFRKIIKQLPLILLILKKKKYVQLIFQKLIQFLKNK